MNLRIAGRPPALRLAVCAVAVATGFGGGAVVGHRVGPSGSPRPEPESGHGHAHDHDHGAPAATPASGYALEPAATTLTGVPDEAFTFRIVGPDGHAVQEFEPRHERDLHLVVVSRDLATYHHLHPTLGADGTWTVGLPALTSGAYRAFASFAVTDGPELTLSRELEVVNPLPETGTSVTVDGYTVTLGGTPVAGVATTVTLTVARDGAPVVLEPYLGAFGHLVAVQAGELTYAHVHPMDDGTFMLHLPSPGDYRLFFDFAHAAAVHTAAFTVHVT